MGSCWERGWREEITEVEPLLPDFCVAVDTTTGSTRHSWVDSNRLAWVATTRYATTWLLQRTLLRGYYEARYYGLLLLVTTWYNYVATGCGRTKRVPAAGRAELLRRNKRGRPGRGTWSWADTSERPPPTPNKTAFHKMHFP